MARRYAVTGFVRVTNWLVQLLNRFGLGGSNTYTLTTLGRKTGKARSTPVTLVEHDGSRYLVAPYGAVGWVHNIRASGIGTLTRSGNDQSIRVRELSATEAGPVLHKYYTEVKITRPYFDVPGHAGAGDFVAVATSHPVFLILA